MEEFKVKRVSFWNTALQRSVSFKIGGRYFEHTIKGIIVEERSIHNVRILFYGARSKLLGMIAIPRDGLANSGYSISFVSVEDNVETD